MPQNQDVDIDADKLTQLLADRMTAVVPAGFQVRAAGGMLWYSAEAGRFPGQSGNYHVGISGTYVRDNLQANDETTERNLATAAAQALDELQDYIDEATHDPWPGDRTRPRPHAQVRGQVLHLWYGGPELHSDIILAHGRRFKWRPPHIPHLLCRVLPAYRRSGNRIFTADLAPLGEKALFSGSQYISNR